MKTKLTLLLAMAISAEYSTAAGPNLPSNKVSTLPRQVTGPAVPMIKSNTRPAASYSLPKAPVMHPAVPSSIQRLGKGMAPGKSPAGNRLPANPQIDIRKFAQV